jgi:hypothetical protein
MKINSVFFDLNGMTKLIMKKIDLEKLSLGIV